MKKLIYLMILGFISISCSNNDDSSPSSSGLSNSPDAKSQYDTSNYGIYKGVFVGSSGHIKININNNNTISASLRIDGVTYNCSTTETVEEGYAISGLTFTYGSSSFDFSVSANGYNPTISNISISGHPNASFSLFKEYSDAQVKCYIGTFSGDDSGVFNLAVTSDGYIVGLAKPNGETNSIALEGSLTTASISGTFSGGTFSGSVSGNNISGQWQNDLLESGNWTGVRTL